MSDIIVSVIIPTFGGGQYLERCIDSVLQQDYKEIEIIVVDDNGIDTEEQIQTSNIINKYIGNSKVHYFCHKKNINGSAARNTGFNNSRGKYISLLDDDDIFYPNKISRQVELMEKLSEEVGAVYCSNDVYWKGKKVSETHAKYSGFLLYEALAHKFQMSSTSMLIRRSVWEDLNGFDESFARHQDWEFVARMADKYMIVSDDFIGFRRYLYGRTTNKTPEITKERREYYLSKMKPLIDKLPESQRRDIYVENRLSAAMKFLKAKKFREFFNYYSETKPGYRGILFLLKRIVTFGKKK